MKESLKKHFTRYELVSFLQTFGAVLAVDAVAQFQNLLSGDLSKTALLALLTAVLRSLWKAVILMLKKPAVEAPEPPDAP